MPAWNSSSLAFSDHNNNRHLGSSLLKNTAMRVSKQHLTEHKLFGSKRGKHGEDIKVGSKMFRKKGKGVVKNISGGSLDKAGSMKSKGISPSIAEFDKMMNSISKGSSKAGKSSMFSRKSFG